MVGILPWSSFDSEIGSAVANGRRFAECIRSLRWKLEDTMDGLALSGGRVERKCKHECDRECMRCWILHSELFYEF